MKAFDLEKALAGEPVVLRGGCKAYVKFKLPEPYTTKMPLVGYYENAFERSVDMLWFENGRASNEENSNFLDIVGMYEEPRPTATINFACPLKELEEGQKFWRITMNSDPLGIAWAKVDVGMSVFDKENVYHLALLDAGLAFKSEEDAQAWFDAMKNARR